MNILKIITWTLLFETGKVYFTSYQEFTFEQLKNGHMLLH